ncbi:MAG TPA: serine/threonine-protein kinase, partial [Gemmataceae bacterium]|nr:serine/threonine-protein kinase [Gemmataceae bacterium]
MNSPQPDSPRAATGAAGHAASAALRFEGAWQQGAGPDLTSFVADLPDISATELTALICIDLDARWQHELPKAAEDYLREFPAVAADAELAVDVIYAEFLAREQSGEQPKLSDFKQRFPRHAAVLGEQVRLHRALAPPDAAQAPQEPVARNDASVSMNVNASYRIIQQIGSGGMGVVYKAHQPALNRYVALKMVRLIDAENRSLLARFRAEAQVVASLRHPHIVQVYDYGEHEGLPYFAMELIEGGTLADHLHGNPWPARVAAELLVKLAGAVQFAHDHRVIHRDLKPANVLIVADHPQLEMKITDFGLAKFYVEEASLHSTTNAFLGTPSYMAPEQANGRIRGVGVGADIYSLGAILYELLTGRPPIRGESPIETLRLLLCTEPLSVHRLAPSIPRDLATICEKCLRSEPAQRYPSAAALRE